MKTQHLMNEQQKKSKEFLSSEDIHYFGHSVDKLNPDLDGSLVLQ